MKKIMILAIVALMGLAFTSCGNRTQKAVEEEQVEEVVDTLAVAADSTLVAE